jgi:WD40 repeat protein/serine/threonine protein kinase
MGSDSSDDVVLLDRLADDFIGRLRRGERPALEEYTERHPELASQIRELFPMFVQMERAKDRDVTPTLTPIASQAPSTGQPPHQEQMGDFRILREIGRGGMGVVYEAEQISLDRRVALKVLPKQFLFDSRTKQRFEREARAAARLHHTNIVPVFGVGAQDGVPYYAMQLIQGTGLDVVIEELARWNAGADRVAARPEVLAIVQLLLTGSDHAAVTDRSSNPSPPELKGEADRAMGPDAVKTPSPPATLLLTTKNTGSHAADITGSLPGAGKSSSGVVRRTFWGSVARVGYQVAGSLAYAHRQGIVHRDIKPSNLLLDESGMVWITDFGLAKAADQQDVTRTGDIPGTLRYLPPEAFEGKSDTRGDVYSLGLTLYELAALRPAFGERDRNRLIKQVTTGEPEPLGRVRKGIPRDLQTIIHRAIERDPARRYQKAEELAADLERFLDDQPVKARRISALERLGRWARRNRAVAAALGVIALLLIGVALASSLAALRFERLATEANRRGEAERRQRYRANMTAAAVALQIPNTGAARRALAAAPEEYRGWEWLHFNRQLDDALAILPMPGVPYALSHPTGGILRPALTFSGDSQRIAAGSPEIGTVGVWHTATGQESGVLPGHGHYLQDLTFGPDGRLLVCTADGTLQAWDLARNDQAILCRIPENEGMLLSPDGRLLVGVQGKHVQLWDVPARRKRADLPGELEIQSQMAVFSRDSRLLAYSTNDGTVQLCDVETGTVRALRGPMVRMRALAFSPDGKCLAAGAGYPENSVRRWSLPAGKELPALRGHQNEVTSVAFSPDGGRLASGSLDETACLWDAGTLIRVLKGHTGIVRQTAFSPDGQRLATASDDETLRLWNGASGELVGVLRGHTGMVWGGIVFSPDGRLLASACLDATVRLWDMAQLERNGVFRGHTSFVYDVAFSPDGSRAVSAAWDGMVRLWDPDTGRETSPPFQHGTGPLDRIVGAACFSPDGRQVVSVTAAGALTFWDVATSTKVRTLHVPPGDWRWNPRAAFQPHGDYVALGAGDGGIRLWDATGEEPIAVLRGHEDPVLDVAFSPDGTQLASAGVDQTVRLWDVRTRSPLAVLRGHETGWFDGLAYSPDGRLLASASRDKTVRVWDMATHEQVATLPHGSAVYGVAFSPDGGRLAAGCADNSIRLWDVAAAQSAGGKEAPEAEVAELRGHEDYVHSVAWSPDGTRLLSASGDRTVRVWDSLSAHERAQRQEK